MTLAKLKSDKKLSSNLHDCLYHEVGSFIGFVASVFGDAPIWIIMRGGLRCPTISPLLAKEIYC
jgi:hypothetical protein